MPTIPRSNAGLLYKDDFNSATGWTAGTGWSFDSSLPTYCMFDPTPLTFEYTPGGIDGGGARELHRFTDTDGTRYIFYGAGDAAGNPWRIHVAKSTDGGLTWTKLGPLNIALSDGAGGTVAAADMLYMEKIGSTYYLHSMTAGSQIQGVPASPYQSRLWTNTALTTTGWTFANAVVGTNSIGTIDTSDDYTGSIVGSNAAGTAAGTAVYHNFTSVRTTGAIYGVGHLVSASRANGFAASAVAGYTPATNPITASSAYGCENPKVFWSAALNKWVMFLTHFAYPAGNSFNQAIYTSSDLNTWTPGNVPGLVVQHQTPLHGSIVGANILSPNYGPGGVPLFDANGYFECSLDNDPSGILDPVNSGRHGRFVVAEPAPNCLHYAPSITTVLSEPFTYSDGSIIGRGGWVRAVGTGAVNVASNKLNMGAASGDSSVVNSGVSVADCTIQADITLTTLASVGFLLRYTSPTNSLLIDFACNGNNGITIVMYKGGTAYTQVGTTYQGADGSWPNGSTHNCKVVMSGSTYACYFDGALLTTFTDATLTTAGQIGLRNGSSSNTGTRLADNLLVTTGISAPATCYRSLAHGDFVAEYAVEFPASGSGSLGFDFHIQDANNYQRLLLTYNGKLTLQRTVAGTTTTLPLNTGVINTATGYLHYLRIESFAGKVTAILDGEKQISYTDNTFPTGTQIGFYSTGGAEARIRTFHMRGTNTVTLQGLTAGHTIVPRTPGGLPIGSYTVPSTGVLSFSYNHYPLATISDNGVDYTPSDSGYIWGGDTLGTSSSTTTIITKRRPTRGRN